MSNEDFFDFPRKFIHGSGLGPSSPRYKRFISLFLLSPMSLALDVLVIYDFWYLEDDIFKTAELLESVSAFAQLIIRKFILIVHGKLIQDVLEERKQFWKYDMFGEVYGTYLRKKMILAMRVMKIMICWGAAIATLMCISAILNENKPILVEIWLPKNSYLCNMIFVMEMLSLVEIIYLVGALDAVYVLMCTDIRIQFLLLRFKLKTMKQMDTQQCLGDLIICTKHHKLLLKIHKKLNIIFSEYFLAQYFISVLAACVQLYILIYTNANVEYSLKAITYLGASFFQVGMFYLPSSDIEEESEKLAVEIYALDWESTDDLRIRKQLLFMLMRAQQPLRLLGGGMFHVNKNEYVALFRLSFSIATLLGGMNEATK